MISASKNQSGGACREFPQLKNWLQVVGDSDYDLT